MTSFAAFHFQDEMPYALGALAASDMRVVKVFVIEMARAAKAAKPGILTVFRHYAPKADQLRWLGMCDTDAGADAAAREYILRFKDSLNANSEWVDFAESINEEYPTGDSFKMVRALRFDEAFIRQLRLHCTNVRPVVFCAAVGNPADFRDWTNIGSLAIQAEQAGGAFGYHAYWPVDSSRSYLSSDDHSRPYNMLWNDIDHWLEAVYGVSVLWILGEAGPCGAGPGGHGWLPYIGWKHPDVFAGLMDRLLHDLQLFDYMCSQTVAAQEGRLLGYCLFTSKLHPAEWIHFQLDGQDLLDVAHHTTVDGPPPPPPPPPPDPDPDPPPPPGEPVYCKVGFHAGVGGNRTGIGDPGYMKSLDDARIPVCIKSVDDVGLAIEAARYAVGSGVPHNIMLRFTTLPGQPNDEPNFNHPPQVAAVEYWARLMQKVPAEFLPFRHIIWLEAVNEIVFDEVTPNHNPDWLARFGLRLAELALDGGFRLALFGMNAGTPEPEQWATPRMLDLLLLLEAHPERLAISLHEGKMRGTENVMLEPCEDFVPHLIGRFQWLLDICDDNDIGHPTIFISEWAWYYQDMPDVDRAMADVRWLAEFLAFFPTVRAAFLWCLQGGDQWGDLPNKLQRLIGPITQYALEGLVIPPAPELPVPAFSQRDPRWRDHLLGDSDTLTIGQAGCAITCAAMLGALCDPTVSPAVLNTRLIGVGGYQGALLKWPQLDEAVPGLEYVGGQDWDLVPADLPALFEALRGGPVIVRVDAIPGTTALDHHFVLGLRHIDGDLEIIDPWDGAQTRLMQRYALTHWDLARAVFGIRIVRVNVPPVPPPPGPGECLGDPRIQYRRVYQLVHPTVSPAIAYQVFLRGWLTARRTTGGSFDDAGIGNLSERIVEVYGCPTQAEAVAIADWYQEHYPGVTVRFPPLPGD